MRYDRILKGPLKCLVLFAVLFLFMAACSGPLKYTYAPIDGTPVKKVAGRPSVYVMPFSDARVASMPQQDPRTIGKITSMVIDMNGSTLTLSDKVTSIVEAAFSRELANAGFLVVAGDPSLVYSDYVLTGEVQDFRLDIGPRDELSISIAAKLAEKSTGEAVWSDTVSEKRSDYAGEWGETRSHISKYISFWLSKTVRTAIAGMEDKLSAPARTPAQTPPQTPSMGGEQATGKLTVATDPDRAEIYIGDVYYGLTPISIDLKPGVYDLTARKTGFRDTVKKVSVRGGETTELVMTLGKE